MSRWSVLLRSVWDALLCKHIVDQSRYVYIAITIRYWTVWNPLHSPSTHVLLLILIVLAFFCAFFVCS